MSGVAVLRRAAHLVVAAAVLIATGVVAVPMPGAAAAGPYRVTLSQLASTLRTGEPDLIVAEVRDATGGPAPDGTLVTFSTSGDDDEILSFDAVGMAPHGQLSQPPSTASVNGFSLARRGNRPGQR